MEFSGAYVKPDKGEQRISFAGLVFSQTTIGRQQWVSFGGLTQGPTTLASAPSVSDLSFAADLWDESPFVEFNCTGNRETVNGVSARKCSIDRATFDRLQQLGGGAFVDDEIKEVTSLSFDLWTSDTRHPIRMRMDIAGIDLSNANFRFKIDMDITDINSNITINPPR
jgi:hypothetical protein